MTHSGQLPISDRLYGRDQAIRSLLTAFEQACQGSGQVQLVPGRSGVGKTALVQAVRGPVKRGNGFFLKGKFNQYQQNIPYFAIRQALAELCRELERDDDLQRRHWKTELLQAVGDLGQLLVDLVPELESLLGKQPPIADISPLEARHRFAGVFRAFLKVLCRPEHPVVLFIDDWQWADMASFDLLTRLQVGTALRYLLVIVAYRDDEVDPAHPLAGAVEELRHQAVPVDVIEIHDLTMEDIRALLADTLKPAVENLDGLAALVHQRTAGNPFFMRAFIEFLYDRKLLCFDSTRARWLWGLGHTGDSALPADVVDLFAQQLNRMTPANRELLSYAACLGNRFDLKTLAVISDHPMEQCRLMLGAGLAQDMVVPAESPLAPEDYLFRHDRVQQAAYALIPPAALPRVRLEIGRRLLAHLDPEQLAEQIFQVADHLNAGGSLIQDPDERVRLVALNLLAAQKARSATAYRTALQFQRAAARLLEPPGLTEWLWQNHHDLAMQLWLAQAEGEFLEGDRNESERCIHQAVAHAANSLEKAEALNSLIVQLTLLARYPDAITAGREALAALDITLPQENFEAACATEIEQVRQALQGRPVAELIHLPVMHHPKMRMAAKLLITMGPPCYRSHQRLWSVIVPKVVNLTIRYGHIPQIGYSHTAFGGLLGWVANDYATAKAFGDLATRLMTSTFDSPSDQSVFYLMTGSSLRHWFEPLQSGSRDYALAYETGLRSGNLQYAAYAFGHNMYCRFYQGTPLPALIQESQRSLDFSRTRVNQWAIDLLEGGLRIFTALTAADSDLDDDETWEKDYLRQVDEHHNIQVQCIYQVLRTFFWLILGQFERALVWSNRVEPLLYTVGTQGLLPWAEHVFARSLILSALHPDAAPDQQAIWRVELERLLAQLGIWAGSCPENFAHQQALIAGEMARLDGQVFAAMRFYHQAIESAAAGRFVPWEGLANERAATFLEAQGQGQLAGVYRQQAYGCYYRWGATRKLQAMESAYRDRLALAIRGMAKPGAADTENELDQKLLSELLEKQLHPLHVQSAALDYANQRNESVHKSQELAEGTERLRIEIAERKRAEEQLQQHRENLAKTIRQRTAELEASRDQLAEARAAALNLMEDAIEARDRSEAGRVALEREMAERKQAEEALGASEHKFRTLFEEMVSGFALHEMVFDDNGKPVDYITLEVNREFERLLGIKREEVIGKRAYETVPGLDRKWLDIFGQVALTGAPASYEEYASNLDKWFSGTVFSPQKGLVAGTFVDITARRKRDEELELFRLMVEKSGDPIFMIDDDDGCRMIYVNQAAVKHYGATRDEILTWCIPDWDPNFSYEKLDEHVAEVRKLRNLTIESLHRVKGGLIVPVEITLNYTLYKGRVCHFGYFRNITERKEREEELKRSNAELEQFSYAVSHDMRQPLRMISSYLQLLKGSLTHQIDDEKRKYLNFAIEGAKRINQMLVELLEYSQIGRTGKSPTWIESRTVLNEALQFLQPAITEAQARVHIAGDWPRILASPHEILRLLQNLIGNAAKFRVAGRTPEISLTSQIDKNEWRLSVADNGIGIAPDQIKRLFQMFQRIQSRTTYEGNGVGLALCRKITEHHKGHIWAESAGENRGCRFYVVLPVLRGTQPP